MIEKAEPLRAGQLNRRVDIERFLSVDDGHGGQERGWQRIGGAWVAATPIGGKESLQAQSLQQSQNWRIEMRPRDVTAEDRLMPIKWRGIAAGRALNIRSVSDPDGERDRIILLCDTLVTG